MSDPRELSAEQLQDIEAEWIHRQREDQWTTELLDHIEYLTERVRALEEADKWRLRLQAEVEVLEEALRDNTEVTSWRPSASGTGSWCQLTCGLCHRKNIEDGPPLVHTPECLLAGLEVTP